MVYKLDHGRIRGTISNELLYTLVEQNEKIIELLQNLQPKKEIKQKPVDKPKKKTENKKVLTCPKCGKTESKGKPFDNKQKLSAHFRACKGVV